MLRLGSVLYSKYVEKLSRLQKRAARVVTGNFDYVNCHGMDLVRKLKWQSFQQRRDYFLATMMFKCIHGLAPTHMINELEMVCERHDHNTRNADSLNVVFQNLISSVLNVVFVSQGLKDMEFFTRKLAECAIC